MSSVFCFQQQHGDLSPEVTDAPQGAVHLTTTKADFKAPYTSSDDDGVNDEKARKNEQQRSLVSASPLAPRGGRKTRFHFRTKEVDQEALCKCGQGFSCHVFTVRTEYLLVILILSVVLEVEVAQVVAVLGLGDHADVVAEQLLLEELLGQVLEVALGEGDLGGHGDHGVITLNGDVVAEDTGLAVDLDSVLQELLESGSVENLICDWLGAVDGELLNLLLGSGLGGLPNIMLE